MTTAQANFNDLIERFENGDRRAVSRLLTLAARGQYVEEVREMLLSRERHSSRTIAFTGNGGVGKSTLVGKSIELLRGRGKRVAVLACDPQSSLTGGALLGDRVRMTPGADDGVFIRSLAVASGQQAIADHLDLMTGLLAAFGFDVVILETVGAGQGDTAVHQVADTVVLLLQPEAGDDLQWEKAGLLEVADVVVINKADLPGSERVEAQVRDMLNLPGCREVPVLRVSAGKNQGIDELWNVLDA